MFSISINILETLQRVSFLTASKVEVINMLNYAKNVIAIRIYYGLNYTPMADLRFADGVIETI